MKKLYYNFYRTGLVMAVCLACWGKVNAQNMLGYAGNQGNERFYGMLRLSDSTVLVAGRATDLSWIPATTRKVVLTLPNKSGIDSNTRIASHDSANLGILLHFSKNLDSIKSVVSLPPLTVTDVTKIRTNTPPGAPTGDIYISGRRSKAGGDNDGYYIGKLNANFLTGVATGFVWTFDVLAPPRRSNQFSGPYGAGGEESDVRKYQPWDVQNDGKVVFVDNREFSDNWSSIKRLKKDGLHYDTVGKWPTHYLAYKGTGIYSSARGSGEYYGLDLRNLPAKLRGKVASNPDVYSNDCVLDSLQYSIFILKVINGQRNFRSRTDADFNLLQNDENGNPGRKGKYPDDYYFNATCDSNCNTNGPGYTGYETNGNGNNTTTKRCAALTIDKRNNNMYIGYSVWSQSPFSNVNPYDFEPAVVALDASGGLKWWARLYKETNANSGAGQLVDGLEIDYNSDQLTVLARSFGNSTINFWPADSITANPGYSGFKKRFSGILTNNIDAAWIGKYRLNTGVIERATWVGEPLASSPIANKATKPEYDGFDDPNAGNPNIDNTRINSISLGTDGSVYAAGWSAGRVLTTSNAYQRNLKPDLNSTIDSLTSPSAFVRVYSPDLSKITYSSLVTGIWDPTDGSAGDNTTIHSILPGSNGKFIFVGAQSKNNAGTAALGAPIPAFNYPTWASDQPQMESAIFGGYSTDGAPCLAKLDSVSGPNTFCTNDSRKYSVTGTPGAIKYIWLLPNTKNWSGTSTTDTIRVTAVATASAPVGGGIRVVSLNSCGVTTISAKKLDPPGTTPTVSSLAPRGANVICASSTRTFGASRGPGVTGFVWKVPSGFVTVPATSGDSVTTTADSLKITFPAGASTATLQVIALGTCGRSFPKTVNLNIKGASIRPDTIIKPVAPICTGIAASIKTNGVQQHTYKWTVSGTGWPTTNYTGVSFNLTAPAGAGPFTISVKSSNGCDTSVPFVRSYPAPNQFQVPIITAGPGLNISTTRVPGATYIWKKNGAVIPNATDTTLLPTGNGAYTVSYLSPCGTKVSAPFNYTGVESNLVRFNTEIYPNPTQGNLTLRLPNASASTNVNVTLFDLLGKEVSTSKLPVSDNEAKLDIHHLPDGIYMVQINHSNGLRELKKVTKH